MARPLSELQPPVTDGDGVTRDLSLTRRTSRSFAAAVAVLLLAAVVVNRSEAALSPDSATSSAIVTSGTVELSDDDEGRSLFDLRDLTPARPVRRCIEVTYDGSVLPVTLAMQVEADGDLADFLDVVIEEGAGGGFEECDTFVPVSRVFRGSLRELADRGPLQLDRIVNRGERRSFRIEVVVQDRHEALGLEAGLELVWEVTPS